MSLYGCRFSVGLGPIHGCFLPSFNHRLVLSDSPALAAAAAAAAKDPRWLMLNLHGCRTDDSFVADAKTVAYSHTSTGRPLRVSFGRAAAPASSFLYYDFPDSPPSEEDQYEYDYISVIAAHTDSVLLQMSNRRCPSDFEDNNFVYTAGAAEPPSLSLIPVRDFLTKSESVYVRRPFRPRLYSGSTGLLRRGENDLLLVQLDLWYDRDARRKMVEFCLLRPGTGMRQWQLMEPVPIIQDQDDDEVVSRSSGGDAVLPVGERYLCWVDCKNGFFLCDMADEARPKVRYVPVPAEVSRCCSSDDYDDHDDQGLFHIKYTKEMGAAGASSVRFVSIDPHCCCGGPGRSTCAHSRFAFTVRTWTMDLSMYVESPLAWVKDGEMDCDEVWALPGYEGLPRANLLCPVVSLVNPNVVCFLVCNRGLSTNGDLKLWMIQLNLKTKTLLSVEQFTGDLWGAFHHLPVQLHW